MEKEKNDKKRKRKLKWQIKLLITILFILLVIYFLGTKGMFIKEFKIETNKIENGMQGLKILQFSDLHFGSSVNKKMLNKLIDKINEAKPDIVIFTGDLIDENYKITNKEKKIMINKLSKINSELGKYYITGEEDFEEATSILNLSGFSNLDNGEQLVYSNDNTPVLLVGANDAKSYEEKQTGFTVLALHDPNTIDKYKEHNFDMALAGHTHNGQINVPKIKNLFIKGNYAKNYQMVNKTKLFINPGIGTSKVNIRMFNHPTIYLFRLYKSAS